MARTGVQVAPEDAGARGGSECQLSQMGPGQGREGRGLREAGRRSWQGGRWRGRGRAPGQRRGAPSAVRTAAVGMAAGAEKPGPGGGRSWEEGAPHE